jgi:uncharacterized membrane protein (UPF0127 family)
MRITNRTRNTLLGTRVLRAASWWSRLRGFIGRPEPMQGEGILLVRCGAIHTWGMAFDLDVLFLDERGTVLKVLRALAPWKPPQRVRGAKYVLEVPVGTIDMSGTQVGDELTWRDPAPYRISVLSQLPGEDSPNSPSERRGSG